MIAVHSRYKFSPRNGRAPHVRQRPGQSHAGFRWHALRRLVQLFGIVAFSQPEIEYLCCAVGGYHHVRGLQVTMHDAPFVRMLQGAGNLPPIPQQSLHRHPTIAQELRKRPPFHVLHGDEDLAFLLSDFIDSANIRVIQRRRVARLVTEALDSLRILHNLGGQKF